MKDSMNILEHFEVSFPFSTMIKFLNTETGKSIVVGIKDFEMSLLESIYSTCEFPHKDCVFLLEHIEQIQHLIIKHNL